MPHATRIAGEIESDTGTHLPHPLDEGGHHVDPGPVVEADGAPAEKTRRNLRLRLTTRKKDKKNGQKSIQTSNEGTYRPKCKEKQAPSTSTSATHTGKATTARGGGEGAPTFLCI